MKRAILHPNFRNIKFPECEKAMADMQLGEVVIRPSRKANDHLTVTWKVNAGVLQHIDVVEEGKEYDNSLGKSLLIGELKFEDLDQIMVHHIHPMASYVRDVMGHRYYRQNGDNREIADKGLKALKTPSNIPYYLSCSTDFPGKFLLSYLPRDTTYHEYFTVTPKGLRFRQQVFASLNSMLRWFKEHFRDAIPGTPASTRTPALASAYTTPNLAMQRMTPGRNTPGRMTPGRVPGRPMYGNMPQVTPQAAAATPSFNNRPFPGAYGASMHPSFQGQPVTTPLMTPSSSFMPQGHGGAVGGHMTTPMGGTATPSYRTPAANPPPPMGSTPMGGEAPSSSSSAAAGKSGAGKNWVWAAEVWTKQLLADIGTNSPRASPP